MRRAGLASLSVLLLVLGACATKPKAAPDAPSPDSAAHQSEKRGDHGRPRYKRLYRPPAPAATDPAAPPGPNAASPNNPPPAQAQTPAAIQSNTPAAMASAPPIAQARPGAAAAQPATPPSSTGTPDPPQPKPAPQTPAARTQPAGATPAPVPAQPAAHTQAPALAGVLPGVARQDPGRAEPGAPALPPPAYAAAGGAAAPTAVGLAPDSGSTPRLGTAPHHVSIAPAANVGPAAPAAPGSVELNSAAGAKPGAPAAPRPISITSAAGVRPAAPQSQASVGCAPGPGLSPGVPAAPTPVEWASPSSAAPGSPPTQRSVLVPLVGNGNDRTTAAPQSPRLSWLFAGPKAEGGPAAAAPVSQPVPQHAARPVVLPTLRTAGGPEAPGADGPTAQPAGPNDASASPAVAPQAPGVLQRLNRAAAPPSPKPQSIDEAMEVVRQTPAHHLAVWTAEHPRGLVLPREQAIAHVKSTRGAGVLVVPLVGEEGPQWQQLIAETAAALDLLNWLDADDAQALRRERMASDEVDRRLEQENRRRVSDAFFKMLLGRPETPTAPPPPDAGEPGDRK